MARIGKTIENLRAIREQWLRTLPSGADAFGMSTEDAGQVPPHLTEVADFGPNPGNLRMLSYVPDDLPAAPALVVVLHGCRQDATGYDIGSGWSELATQQGFVLCLPEQRRSNNPNNCFNWFQAGDIERGQGEAASIAAMVGHLVQQHGIDRKRIFVTGLSAGGAMTSVMLATYPELFAAGAVIAGLPYKCAISVQAAFESMSGGDSRSPEQAAESVRQASPHRGPWPRLSVWHGTADHTVTHGNAAGLTSQWAQLFDVDAAPAREEVVSGQTHRVWTDAKGAEVIEEYVIAGLGHGTPLEAGPDEGQYGAPGPYLLEAGISSTYLIAQFWGLVPKSKARRTKASTQRPEAATTAANGNGFSAQGLLDQLKPGLSGEVNETIRKALRSAGLL